MFLLMRLNESAESMRSGHWISIPGAQPHWQ